MRPVIGAALIALSALVVASQDATAQNRGNASQAWGSVYRGPSIEEQTLRDFSAIRQHNLERYGANALGGGGGGGGGGTSVYNGTVNNIYNGPVSNSGSNATSIGNYSSTDVNGSGNSVGVNQGNTQGSQGSGASSSANQSGSTNSGSNIR